MSFYFHGIPTLENYHQARRHYDATIPIRGNGCNAGRMPLGDRKHAGRYYMMDHKTHIDCVYYATVCVRYYEDGRVWINHEGWDTATTMQFINALIVGVIGYVQARHRKVLFGTSGYEFEVPEDGGLELRFDSEKGQWLPAPDTVPPCVVHTIDRKVMSKARKEYQWAITYISGLVKLWDYKYEGPNNVWTHSDANTRLAIELGKLRSGKYTQDDMTKLNMLAVLLMFKFGYPMWVYKPQGGRRVRCVGPTKFAKGLDWALQVMYAPAVFKCTELPFGMYKKDRHIATIDWVNQYGTEWSDLSSGA